MKKLSGDTTKLTLLWEHFLQRDEILRISEAKVKNCFYQGDLVTLTENYEFCPVSRRLTHNVRKLTKLHIAFSRSY